MPSLDDLRLVPRDGGYEFRIGDEFVGFCVIEEGRITYFEVAQDQRRRGIGTRAMQMLLGGVSSLEVEIFATNAVARAFLESLGFTVQSLVFQRASVPSTETVELFRPVGQKELELIQATDMTRFPPRLPDQPIFYPVTTLEYARLIASDWNVRDEASGFVGYVLRFRVLKEYLDRHPPREAGGRDLIEYWIPSEELVAFNQAIVGLIEVVERYGAPA